MLACSDSLSLPLGSSLPGSPPLARLGTLPPVGQPGLESEHFPFPRPPHIATPARAADSVEECSIWYPPSEELTPATSCWLRGLGQVPAPSPPFCL